MRTDFPPACLDAVARRRRAPTGHGADARLLRAPRGSGLLATRLLAHAEVRLARNDTTAARSADRAAALFGAARMPLYEASARITAGTALAANGRVGEALRQLDQAAEHSAACGATALLGLADSERNRITPQGR
ncbi:hypothetical protein ABZV31_01465 [Streptomyces sp. NPDC005202]|uniref:hypothetical protein n=1 Tax=Streptomyces sp. NPDC005202 TaxID=3157021 RepID=UPI0033ACF169